jgi:hypothetical protein
VRRTACGFKTACFVSLTVAAQRSTLPALEELLRRWLF